MLTLVMIVALVLLAWLILKPEWMPAPPENDLKEQMLSQSKRLKEKSTTWYGQVKPFWKKKDSLGVQLKAWALNEDLVSSAGFSQPQSEMLAGFQDYIKSISDVEADVIAQELSAFCAKQGVNIRWLLDDKGKGDMQKALSALVLFYGAAVRERANSRPSAVLRLWEDAPLAKGNREFGRQLYTRLVDAHLISIPSHLLLAPEKERLAHLVSAIKDLVAKDRDALLPYAAAVLEIKPVAKSAKVKEVKPAKAAKAAKEEAVVVVEQPA